LLKDKRFIEYKDLILIIKKNLKREKKNGESDDEKIIRKNI
jgi:hypothetical protein